ncbi:MULTISPECIES: ATP synthase subunit I [unclassified Mycobacteroides]|uniref:ATP synthase subunit I n=1 Tax=unclassified Mycobacteroides TaxID=2618759 RepID=UPI00281691DA|nr:MULTISPECIES: ATP synthase subunit I [unclassified Mycobacteroides]
MTAPQASPDAPLVLPALAFRPLRLTVLCGVLGALALLASALLGNWQLGAFFVTGLGLGLVNALLVRQSAEVITAQDNPSKQKMAINSAARLMIITVLALVIAYLFRPAGLGVLFGVALFQVLLVLTTAVPVWKGIRSVSNEQGAA